MNKAIKTLIMVVLTISVIAILNYEYQTNCAIRNFFTGLLYNYTITC